MAANNRPARPPHLHGIGHPTSFQHDATSMYFWIRYVIRIITIIISHTIHDVVIWCIYIYIYIERERERERERENYPFDMCLGGFGGWPWICVQTHPHGEVENIQ
jgi:hypothetical protein